MFYIIVAYIFKKSNAAGKIVNSRLQLAEKCVKIILNKQKGLFYMEELYTVSLEKIIEAFKLETVYLPDLPEKHSYSEPYVLQLSDGSFLAGIRSEKSGAVGTSYSNETAVFRT